MQKALGIDLPVSGWLIGMKITDPTVKKMVADGCVLLTGIPDDRVG